MQFGLCFCPPGYKPRHQEEPSLSQILESRATHHVTCGSIYLISTDQIFGIITIGKISMYFQTIY